MANDAFSALPALEGGQPRSAKPDETVRFRPRLRPRMALLQILDDGASSAENVRIRKTPFVIGRIDGDVVIPHDGQISSRHAQIVARHTELGTEWLLQDLGSTNGVFVRAANIVLQANQVVMIGSRLFASRNVEGQPPEQCTGATLNTGRQWQYDSEKGLDELIPALREISDGGGEITLKKTGLYVGSDPDQCDLLLTDDLVSPRHARIYCDHKERWRIEDLDSTNGIWVKTREAVLGGAAEFRCGEQLFRFKSL